MVEPHCYMIEFEAIDVNGDVIDYFDTLDQAKAAEGCVLVTKIEWFSTRRTDVWDRDDLAEDGEEE